MIPAEEMRRLPPETRDALIAAGRNVLDGRARFEAARRQAQLADAYRKPQRPPPDGPRTA